MIEACQRCFFTIVANYNGLLEAVHCCIHSVRYDMVPECCLRPSHIGPHQVTYEAVAWLIHLQRALVVEYILSCYRNRLRHNNYNGPLEAVHCDAYDLDFTCIVDRYLLTYLNRYPLSTYEGEQEDPHGTWNLPPPSSDHQNAQINSGTLLTHCSFFEKHCAYLASQSFRMLP
eukprot:scaffold19035_cov207-Skeletonema_dohrnii-CCMP3373.AAC.1